MYVNLIQILLVPVEDGFTMKAMQDPLFTSKTILIGYRPQNYVNKQWVLHNFHRKSNKYNHWIYRTKRMYRNWHWSI